ncbi:MAG: DUF5053 domain-containing protein [Flavobacteriaceae bacterium]|nr:DUF5053 domain-containing protein [Flavobacteriaceae bacterium]
MNTTKTKIKSIAWDILTDITWANISKTYFGRSRGWIYQKMNGIDGNGNQTEFSDYEKITLKLLYMIYPNEFVNVRTIFNFTETAHKFLCDAEIS